MACGYGCLSVSRCDEYKKIGSGNLGYGIKDFRFKIVNLNLMREPGAGRHLIY